MKYIITLISILYCINCFSQDPNPALFQTWYLRFVQSNDLAPAYNVLAIAPSISPTLTISNTLNFTGVGACNTFSGSFVNTTSSYWQITSFSESAVDCGTVIHNQFEDNYFGFLQSSGGWYQIYPEGAGLVLRMDNAIFGHAEFQNFQLKTNEFKLEQLTLYPNPAKEVVHLNAGQLAISKIQIINSLGQNVRAINEDFETISIANLAKGIYILKIDTELGTINRKIIKE